MCTSPTNFTCSALVDNWNTHSCSQTMRYSRIMGSKPNSLAYSRKGLQPYVDRWTNFLKRYTSKYEFTDNVKSSRYCPLQENIISACTASYTSPLCSDFLDDFCSTVTRDRARSSRTLTNLCGCRVPPDEKYFKYTKSKQCDPLCNRVRTAKKVNLDTGEEDVCRENVCVINDYNTHLTNSSVQAGSTINQICGHCGKTGCMCIISGPNVPQLMKDAELRESYVQFCSGNSVCITKDADGGEDRITDCSKSLEKAKEVADKRSLGRIDWRIFAFAVAFVILCVAMYVYSRLRRHH